MNKVKKFYSDNKDIIVFCYVAIVTIVAIFSICLNVLLVGVTNDLVEVVNIRDYQMQEMQKEITALKQAQEELTEELRSCTDNGVIER